MTRWLNLGQVLAINAVKFSDEIALKERTRAYSYTELNRRSNQLAHRLVSLGLKKGDKVAVLLENCTEIVEIFMATAKTGLIIVPMNFRLVGPEIEYIVNDSDAKILIVHDEFISNVEPIRSELKNIEPDNFIVVKTGELAAEKSSDYKDYESFIDAAPVEDPDFIVEPEDAWILIYTSGTTGKPKGVVRSHASHIAFYLINAIDFGFTERDRCLNVMPLCHINSVFFTFAFLYIGGFAYIHPARSFKAEDILQIVESEKISFISLVPTHYNMILNVPKDWKRPDTSSIKKLLCSSAPASRSVKMEITKFFPGVELFEAYGSTEAGSVTTLKPWDQIRKLGSVGRESVGTSLVKLLDDEGNDVKVGEVGELYSSGPMLFDEYYKLPEKTADSFRGEWFSAGDLARQDPDGYYYIVDRKNNMIITGGENVYPSEVEDIVCSHPDVFDAAVIGLPDQKWGEQIVAVVVPKAEAAPDLDQQELLEFCRGKMADYKRPKQAIFIGQDDMPRTGTGKILHRILKEKLLDK